MFDDRVVSYVGEKRHIPPPCSIRGLPKLDFVLISHDHYDHCNTNSLNEISQRYENEDGDDIIFLVGKNSSDVLPKNCRKKGQFKEMSWT